MTQDATGAVVARDFEVQALASFANVRAVLDAAGAAWDDIVDVTVFLTHMERGLRGAQSALGGASSRTRRRRPCRTTVEVGRLPTPIDIELKVIARTKPSR